MKMQWAQSHVTSILLAMTMAAAALAQSPAFDDGLVLARLRYGGGGDWYNDPSSLVNLARYLNENTRVRVAEREAKIVLTDEAVFSHPILFMTGHGRIRLNDAEVETLRAYLLAGGFLYADDDYGMDADFRALMKRVFPSRQLGELSFSHGIYRIHFPFPNGLPKIHEHDKKPPQGFGLFDDQGRLMVFYTFECNLADGWADAHVHGDPQPRREAALKMGVNIIVWALSH